MKKLFLSLAVLSMAASFVACSGNAGNGVDSDSIKAADSAAKAAAATETVNVDVVEVVTDTTACDSLAQ